MCHRPFTNGRWRRNHLSRCPELVDHDTLATHRVTYRFLGLLLVTLGVAQGGPLVEAFGDVVCVLLGGCAE
ncbi:gp19.5 family protein [Pseudomonas sp. BGI-2]|uniref:gp19.5 family protein n=1 Tax=Pseudomonas sp. BGI-2 TaxID=2528211 RepID=UPI003532498C